MRILSIITARGGSKKLPNKNILKLKKKPLIAHTIFFKFEIKFNRQNNRIY